MERLRLPGFTTGLAVLVAASITPLVAPPPDAHRGAVQIAADASDLFTALSDNLNSAATEFGAGLTALFNLDLPDGLGQLAAAAFNLAPLIPENVLLAGVSGLLNQDLDAYLNFLPGFADLLPADWSALLPTLDALVQSGLNSWSDAVQDLLGGDVANAVAQALLGLDYLVLLAPAVLVIGVPALVGDSLLALVGL